MYDDGSSVGRLHGLDAPHEDEQRTRVVGDAVVRPRGELELTHLAALRETALQQRNKLVYLSFVVTN